MKIWRDVEISSAVEYGEGVPRDFVSKLDHENRVENLSKKLVIAHMALRIVAEDYGNLCNCELMDSSCEACIVRDAIKQLEGENESNRQ